jgi:hypothetical protein
MPTMPKAKKIFFRNNFNHLQQDKPSPFSHANPDQYRKRDMVFHKIWLKHQKS